MRNMQWWEWLLLASGAYIAVMTLARLIRRRRQELLAELTRQVAARRRKKRGARKAA
ncbi:MAG TPA: hypothetical protein VFB96_25420 [Pirellulaceae bacterium]|nr:hypothetical protein [Pirellulaceae bacterium]